MTAHGLKFASLVIKASGEPLVEYQNQSKNAAAAVHCRHPARRRLILLTRSAERLPPAGFACYL
jgi:hypothetical protein